MLSKLNYYSKKSHFDLQKSRVKRLTLELVDHLTSKGCTLNDIKSLSTGTLGLSYLAKMNGAPVFLKTHLNSISSKDCLLKEIAIYENYYLCGLNCRKIVIGSDEKNTKQYWLSMNVLCTNINKINPDIALNIIANFPDINSIRNRDLRNVLHDFDAVLHEGYLSLELLEKQKYLSKETVLILKTLIKKVEDHNKYFEMSLCHGDLSPLNIIQNNNNQLIAIDWEDAFYGPKGYDYLYWLTFFDNRIFYNKLNFERSGFDIDLCIALMCLIILIKGKLSLCSGAIKKNTLSINDRLNEVITIYQPYA